MQTIRGTKDILPNEIQAWQQLYLEALNTFTLYNYNEIRTPIIENSEVFLKSVGNSTDIVNKEMYRFKDQGQRDIALRPEGTACIARAIVSNKLYNLNPIQKLWYMGPMFRYERPQQGRQRQFHQLGVECIGSTCASADAEVIHIAHSLLNKFQCKKHIITINSLGNEQERQFYKEAFTSFLKKYENELDEDSKKRLYTNPLRILDSKNTKTQELLQEAPCINKYLNKQSKTHFNFVCESLEILNIPYTINHQLVRGLDYYSHTAFEISNDELGSQNTICGGGRYSNLIKQFGGPDIAGVGWAIGVERLLILTNKKHLINNQENRIEIITESLEAKKKSLLLVNLLEKHNIKFNLNFSNQNLNKQIKKAIQNQALGCIIIGHQELQNCTITVKWLREHCQETIQSHHIIPYLQNKLKQHK